MSEPPILPISTVTTPSSAGKRDIAIVGTGAVPKKPSALRSNLNGLSTSGGGSQSRPRYTVRLTSSLHTAPSTRQRESDALRQFERSKTAATMHARVKLQQCTHERSATMLITADELDSCCM
jgi:hypothetical protein